MRRWEKRLEKFLCAVGLHEWCHYTTRFISFHECNRCEKRAGW